MLLNCWCCRCRCNSCLAFALLVPVHCVCNSQASEWRSAVFCQVCVSVSNIRFVFVINSSNAKTVGLLFNLCVFSSVFGLALYYTKYFLFFFLANLCEYQLMKEPLCFSPWCASLNTGRWRKQNTHSDNPFFVAVRCCGATWPGDRGNICVRERVCVNGSVCVCVRVCMNVLVWLKIVQVLFLYWLIKL